MITFLTALMLSMVIFVASLPLGLLTKLILLGYCLAAAGYWIAREVEQHRSAKELTHLRSAYDQLDQQAKLIIRTDFELHRTQEALDRKVASLFALHELGQQLRISMRPDDIYSKLNAQLITSFGFSKGLIGTCPTPTTLTWHAVIGISDETADTIRQHLMRSGWLAQQLRHPTPTTYHVRSATDEHAIKILELLDSHLVVVSGLTPQAGPAGCLLLAREGVGADAGRGDEELVAILVTQLSIALENSALYEEVWRARQALERKVQARTQELASANTELTKLNKAKSDFVSAVSHELRTPLAAIKGYASLLRSGQFGPLAKDQAERMAKIEKHADLLTQLINNLLDIARIESGRLAMERQPIEMKGLMMTVTDIVKPQFDAKRIRFTAEVDGVRHLVGDPTHLPRVLINLLTNAAKYTPEGGRITLTLERNHAQTTIRIQDSGCGIAAEELPKLFQEFYRAANPVNDHVRGTGLGLALVKRIIDAHHGQIWIESELGKGTTVSFTLPDEADAGALA